MARKSLSKSLRFKVFKRDNFACYYCGRSPPAVILHADHIVPVAGGGEDTLENLITACADCNLGKGAKPLSENAKPLAARAAEEIEREEQVRAYRRMMKAKRKREEGEIDEIQMAFQSRWEGFSFKPALRESVRRFLVELDFDTVIAAMYTATQRTHERESCVKYFCGICWRRIKNDGRWPQ